STTINTVRDIALDPNGNLLLVTNTSSDDQAGTDARIEYIPKSLAVDAPGTITGTSSVEWYYDQIFQGQPGYTGIDVGFGAPGSGSKVASASVPEPASFALVLVGVASLGWRRRRA